MRRFARTGHAIPLFGRVTGSSTKSLTVLCSPNGPKLKASQKTSAFPGRKLLGFVYCRSRWRYPEIGSNTCCHGRVALCFEQELVGQHQELGYNQEQFDRATSRRRQSRFRPGAASLTGH